jgi:hypothetical protein
MKIEEQTGSRSAAETDREPWEPCSAREEIGMSVFYLAERLCYRGAFLLSGACNRCLLTAGDYWRAKRERLAHVLPGLREEEPGVLFAGQKAHRRGRHGGANDFLTPSTLSAHRELPSAP